MNDERERMSGSGWGRATEAAEPVDAFDVADDAWSREAFEETLRAQGFEVEPPPIPEGDPLPAHSGRDAQVWSAALTDLAGQAAELATTDRSSAGSTVDDIDAWWSTPEAVAPPTATASVEAATVEPTADEGPGAGPAEPMADEGPDAGPAEPASVGPWDIGRFASPEAPAADSTTAEATDEDASPLPVAPATLPDARPPSPPAFLAARFGRARTAPAVEAPVSWPEPHPDRVERDTMDTTDLDDAAAPVLLAVDRFGPSATPAAPDDDAEAPVIDADTPWTAAPSASVEFVGYERGRPDVSDEPAIEPVASIVVDDPWRDLPGAREGDAQARTAATDVTAIEPEIAAVEPSRPEAREDADGAISDQALEDVWGTRAALFSATDDPWAAQAAEDRVPDAVARSPFAFEAPVEDPSSIGATLEEHAVAAEAEEQARSEAAADVVAAAAPMAAAPVAAAPEAAAPEAAAPEAAAAALSVTVSGLDATTTASTSAAEPAAGPDGRTAMPPPGSLRGVGRRPPLPPRDDASQSSELWALVTDQAATRPESAARPTRSASALLTLLVALVVLVLVAGFVVMFTDLL